MGRSRLVSAAAATIFVSGCTTLPTAPTDELNTLTEGTNAALLAQQEIADTINRERTHRLIAAELDAGLTLVPSEACSTLMEVIGGDGGDAATVNLTSEQLARLEAARDERAESSGDTTVYWSDVVGVLASECDVTVQAERGPEVRAAPQAMTAVEVSLSPIDYCGLSLESEAITVLPAAEGQDDDVLSLPVASFEYPGAVVIAPALAQYTKGLRDAAAASDLSALSAANLAIVDSVAGAAAAVPVYGPAAEAALKSLGALGNAVGGFFMERRRFELIKDTVEAANDYFMNASRIACHTAVLSSYPALRREENQLIDQIADLQIESTTSEERVAGVAELDAFLQSLRTLATTNVADSYLAMATAHSDLNSALQDPEVDLEQVFETLKDLGEKAKKAAEDLEALAAVQPS